MFSSLTFSSTSNTLDYFKSSAKAADSDVSSCSDEEPDSPSTSAKPPTPASRIQAIVEKYPFAREIESPVQRDLTQALDEFEDEYPDSPRGLRAHKINETLGAAVAQFKAKPPTAAFHREAFKDLLGCEWGLDLLSTLKQIPTEYPAAQSPTQIFPRAINMDHIVKGEVKDGATRGLHLCPPGSAARAAMQDVRQHPVTGVLCGMVQLEGGSPKFSTLFPDTVRTEEELIHLIESADPLFHGKDGRVLMITNAMEPDFLFEITLTRTGKGQLITAAYPIFHCWTFEAGQTYPLTAGISISSTDIFQRLLKLPKKELDKLCVYEYITSEGVPRRIVDIGSLFPQSGIKQGVYVDMHADLAVEGTAEMNFLTVQLAATVQTASEAIPTLYASMHELCNSLASL